jgi:hypothetical protein
VKGEIRIKQAILLWDATHVAAPVPIDRPNTIKFCNENSNSFVKKFTTYNESLKIWSSEGSPLYIL